MKGKGKELLRQLLLEVVGCAFVAAGVYNFAVQAGFPMTGITGIAIIINRFTRLPIGFLTILMNVPLALFCYKRLGKRFFFSSIFCMVLSSLMIDYIAPLFPVYTGDRLLSALCTGVLSGFGYALIYTQNAGTGGTDFLMMAIKSYNQGLSPGTITMAIDGTVILLGGVLFGDVDGLIYGLIVSVLVAVMADKVVLGFNEGKMALIVTDQAETVYGIIDALTARGATLIPAKGAFSGEQKEIVLCTCSNKEIHTIRRAVRKADPKCFFIILNSNEVHGEGFRMVSLGEQQE